MVRALSSGGSFQGNTVISAFGHSEAMSIGRLQRMRRHVVRQHQHRRLAGLRKLARHAVHEVGPHAVKVVQILLDGLHRARRAAARGTPWPSRSGRSCTCSPACSGRWPTGWLRMAAATRCGARSISFIANGPPMQLPKKKNWRMPRWSITPSWSSANAPHGSSTGTGPVDSPLLALRWSMVITRKSFLNSSGMLITAFGQLPMREFKPPPGVASSGKPGADLGVADADVALLVEADLGARRHALDGSGLRRLREHLRRGCRRRGCGACRQNGASAGIDHRRLPCSALARSTGSCA